MTVIRNSKVYKPFPLSVIVKNCYVKKVDYAQGEYDGKKYECIALSFNKEDRWLNAKFYNPIRTEFFSQQEYQSARSRLRRNLEHIASTYLDTDEMIDLFQGDYKDSFKTFAEAFVGTLNSKGISKISVDIKTTKYKGRIGLPTSPFFMKASNNQDIEFKYSEYEIKQIGDPLN